MLTFTRKSMFFKAMPLLPHKPIFHLIKILRALLNFPQSAKFEATPLQTSAATWNLSSALKHYRQASLDKQWLQLRCSSVLYVTQPNKKRAPLRRRCYAVPRLRATFQNFVTFPKTLNISKLRHRSMFLMAQTIRSESTPVESLQPRCHGSGQGGSGPHWLHWKGVCVLSNQDTF